MRRLAEVVSGAYRAAAHTAHVVLAPYNFDREVLDVNSEWMAIIGLAASGV